MLGIAKFHWLPRRLVVSLFSLVLLGITTYPAVAKPSPAPDHAAAGSSAAPTEGPALTLDTDAAVESDSITTDESAFSLEGVTLPASFRVSGTRSYVLDASGARVYFPADVASRAASTWWDGVCTDGESRYATVKDYPREKAHSRMERTYARMYCGKKDRDSEEPLSEAAFGIRHIRAYHKSQFAKLASWQGSTWGNWMHWALRWVMSEPSLRTVQNANRFCYEKPFNFTNANGEAVTRYVVALLGKTGVRIMTAFPRNKSYCLGVQF
ncbi:hypothetical protein [Nocardioides bruguierae]|uniref:Uncharacterized protein n=1 Tax=Nocardioides bruguierae TaxID=2945102 RepID=A0A9X2DE21_9ACTN|nr:hypothetical protein [Nocardioides bruguierae]MCM0622724.1 hypothetical protein [Nocardioides bruguierae]